MKVRAAVLASPGRVEVVQRELGRLSDDAVRLRITEAGLCTSDVDKYRGVEAKLPDAIGHELAGVVAEVGQDVTGLAVGDTVVAWTASGGGMAEMYDVPARYCVKIGASVPFPAAAEPLACVLNTVELAAQQVGDDVLVVGGTGWMGLLLVRVASLAGARTIIATGRRPEGLALAEAFGATLTVDTRTENLASIVNDVTGGDGVDVSYEMTGVEAGIDLAGRMVRPGRFDRAAGTVVIGGFHQGGPRPTDWGRWNGRGLNVRNAHFRPEWTCMAGMRRAVRLLEGGLVDAGQLRTDVFGLDEVDAAFQTASLRRRGFVKSVVVFD